MIYEDIVEGYFPKRMNRFVSEVLIEDKKEIVHARLNGVEIHIYNFIVSKYEINLNKKGTSLEKNI